MKELVEVDACVCVFDFVVERSCEVPTLAEVVQVDLLCEGPVVDAVVEV